MVYGNRLIYALCFLVLSTILTGCAGLTGVTDWKERTIQTAKPSGAAFHAVSIALAEVGQVKFSDPESGTISGECAQQVDASIIITSSQNQTQIVLKSKINAGSNEMVIEMGDREKCLDKLEAAIRRRGI
jgi:hypothetical protein